MRAPIKTCAMGALASPAPQAAAAAAQVVARLGAIEMPASQWPELPAELQALVSGPQASSDTAKACALDAIGFLCEDVDEDALPPGSVDALLTPIVFGMQPAAPGADPGVRMSATRALLNSLGFTKANFEKDAERDAIMGAVLAAMAPPAQPPTGAEAPEVVRVAAYECAARVVELYYDKVGPYIHKLFELTVGAIRGGEGEPVVLQAIEFWTAMCEEEDDILSEHDEFGAGAVSDARTCHNYIAGAFEHLLPLLLTNTLTKQDESADDNEWNVAAAGAVCLGAITYTCGNLAEVSKNSTAVETIVQTVLAFVQARRRARRRALPRLLREPLESASPSNRRPRTHPPPPPPPPPHPPPGPAPVARSRPSRHSRSHARPARARARAGQHPARRVAQPRGRGDGLLPDPRGHGRPRVDEGARADGAADADPPLREGRRAHPRARHRRLHHLRGVPPAHARARRRADRPVALHEHDHDARHVARRRAAPRGGARARPCATARSRAPSSRARRARRSRSTSRRCSSSCGRAPSAPTAPTRTCACRRTRR